MYVFGFIIRIVIFGSFLLPSRLPAQIFEDCQQVIPPFSWGGIDVDHILGDNVVVQSSNQPNTQICFGSGNVVQYPNIHLGAHDGSCGWNPFTYKLNFSKPIISISLLLVNGNMVDVEEQLGEDFVFKSECSSISIQSLFSCNSTIVMDTLYLGGNDIAPSVGHGWFLITFSQPVNTFTISGKGGGCGSGFKICANSLNQAPLWAGVHGEKFFCGSGSLFFERFGWRGGPYTYTYNINGGPDQTYVTDEILAEVQLSELFGGEPPPGQYTIELTEIKGGDGWPVPLSCNTSHTFEVAQQPTAQFTATPSSGIAPLAVTIQNQSTNATDYTWFLNESGGFDSAQPPVSLSEAPTFNLEAPGSYEITLVATSALGCTDTTTQTVHVLEDFQVTIPNIFTPNNDGANDFFGITTNMATKAHLTVLNRWGNPVFEKAFITQTAGFQELWDGTSTSSGIITNPSSVTVPEGVYFYKLKMYFSTTSEEYKEFVGFVTVER